jgi:hypothetical protein
MHFQVNSQCFSKNCPGGVNMNPNGEYKSSKSLDLLSSFRVHAFRAFGKRAEFSDALWFAIWSGKAVGGRLARVLLNDSAYEAVKLIMVVALETFFQGFIRCRDPIFFLPSKWLSDQTSSVLQTWRDFKATNETAPNFQDKFFGDFFDASYAEGKLSLVDIITDDVSKGAQSINLLVGRAENVRFFSAPTPLEITRTLFVNVPSLLRMIFSVSGVVPKLACFVVFFGIANQRSRHAFKLYQLLAREVIPFLQSQKNPATLYLPYETQPEQNALAAAWREGGGLSVGYVHSTMLTFPSHYLRPNFGFVDTVWCHGLAYHDVLTILGWSNNQIKRIKTLRFSKVRNSSHDPGPGSVYLPYWSRNLLFAISQIEMGVNGKVLSVHGLKPHPATGISQADRTRFEKIIGVSGKCLPQIITVGPLSVPLEELERGTKLDIIHVPTSEAPWDSFCLDIWSKYITYEPIAEGVRAYRMRLKFSGSFIDFGD